MTSDIRFNINLGNGLSHVRRQAITWNSAGLLLITLAGSYSNEILYEIQKISVKKMHMKMSSAQITTILFRYQCVNSLRPSDAYMRQ